MNKLVNFLFVIFVLFGLFLSQNSNAQAPTITNQPSTVIKCENNSATMTIEASGAEPISYEWFKDGMPVGTNSPILEFLALTPSDEGEYYCHVSNGEGNVDSDIKSVIVVEGEPIINNITTENDLVCEGTNNLFEVDYTGENSQVTWFFGSNTLGYTSQYNLFNAQESDEGQYFCTVSNACGEVTSTNLDIEVVAHADITTQPTTQTICEGEDAIFTPQAEGDYLNYMWLADGIMMLGETETSLTITEPTYPHSIQYKFIAYNVCNNDTSNGVYVTINTLPEITANPINHSECFGEDITLYATATATTEVTYQWYDEDFEIIDGATSTMLDIEMLANDTSYYYCEITNICGTVYTDTAEIITLMVPIITQQPNGGVLCVGDDITMEAKAGGSDPLYYQWLFNGADVSGANISGDESQTMIINDITQGQSGTYTCHVSNMCGFVLTNDAEVTVNIAPIVTEQPEDLEVCAEQEISIGINYSGTEPVTFEWFILETASSIGTDATYTSLSADPAYSGSYYCILTNSCGEISTDTIDVEILALPQITTHPVDETVCVGEYAEMEIEASGAEPLDFLWYKNGSAVSGQTSSLLEYPSAQVNQSGEYFCRVSNECGYDDSGTAILTIGTEPAITWNPIDQTICEHDTLNLIMDAQGENYTLQWYFNNNPIPGANDTVLNIVNTPISMAGEYFCSAFNACATVNSDTIDVTIHEAPMMTLGDDIDLCDGESTTIGPTGDYTHYNWNNGFSYQPSLEVQLSGTYILEVTGEYSCKTKDTLVVTFHPYHQILFDDTEIIACGPYTLNAGDGGYGYVWNTTPPANTSSILITESGTYSVTVSGDEHGCSSTQSTYVDVREPVSINLGNDLNIPVSSFVDIGVEPIYAQYLWNTGFDGPMLTVYGSVYGVGNHEFVLTVIAQNACTATDTINVNFWNDSGVEENTQDYKISIYPNPTNDYLIIQDAEENMLSVDILNITGQVIESFAINNCEVTLNLSNFAEGIYFVRIKRTKDTVTRKIQIR
ncbi:MAG: immunoglobulin domain-containing protein [Bacteroidales bacterium]|nr:immunoglobulin domain-containing protein [Bacteroidales bacterium]